MKKTTASRENALEPAVSRLTATLFHQASADLAEGPVWDAGRLAWVDIPGKTIWAKAEPSSVVQRFDVGLEVGAFAFCAGNDRKLILATERGFQLFDLTDGRIEPWFDPESDLPGNRFNDGKCDPRGRFIAGTLNRAGVRGRGSVYQLTGDRKVRRLFGGVTCSNGLAWSASGTTLYYIDSPTRVVRAFSYDPETGDLGRDRVAIEIPIGSGTPDGMTIDDQGRLWIALWDGWGVECWDPANGKRCARIDLPVARVTSCTFGGADFASLFITTAREGLSASALADQPLAGSIFVAHPAARGVPAVRFALAQ